MLLQAVLEAKVPNQRVLLIEAQSGIGGSWRAQTHFGHHIDNGPHLLYNFNCNNKNLITEIQSHSGASFVKMSPRPHSNHKLGCHILEMSFGFGTNKFKKAILFARLLAANIGFLGLSYPYFQPQNGLCDLVQSFENAFVNLGGEIRVNSSVKRILEDENSAYVLLANDETITAGKVYATARCIPTLEALPNGSPIPEMAWRTYSQVYIHLTGVTKTNFSYFRPFDTGPFFLAADLSSSARPELARHEVILSLNLLDTVNPEDVNDDDVINFLQKYNLVSGKIKLVDLVWETISYPNITAIQTAKAQESLKRIKFTHCNNLMRSFNQILDHAKNK